MHRTGRAGPLVATAIGAVVLGAGVGAVLSGVVDGLVLAPLLALAVLGVGLAATAPQLLPMLALPATLLLARIGGALSVSDVVLAVSFAFCFLFVRARELFPMRMLLWAGAAYLVAALPTVVLNPYAANVVEWVHEAVLVIGSLVVGFAVGRTGYARMSVGLYVLACAGIGVAAMAVSAAQLATGQGLLPVYLPELHKNTIGGALAVAIVLLYAKPVWFRWPQPWATVAIVACIGGLAASGARQGAVGAIIGLLIVALRRDPDSGRLRLLPWLVVVPIVIAVITLVDDQFAEDNRFNSVYQRLEWLGQSIDVWQSSPWFGVGLRWWYLPQYPDFQPPNAEIEVLTSTGIVGLVGFLAMFAIALVVLWRMDPAYGTAAVAVVATRFTQAQFDLYWVAGQASALWIVAGIAFGALVRHDAGSPEQSIGDVPTRGGRNASLEPGRADLEGGRLRPASR